MNTKGYIKRKITAPAMKHRNGWKAPKTTLIVYVNRSVGIPWATMRPLVACAFRHVQKTAFDDLQLEFINRCKRNSSELWVNSSHHHTGSWWGRNVGIRSRIFIGTLHDYPEKSVYVKFKEMPINWHANWLEHLVGLTAHELWHRWQPGHGRPAEFMCETVEGDAIDRYRKEQKYTFTPPPEVHQEPDDMQKCPAESCVDCQRETRFWLPDMHTPLCPTCNERRIKKWQGITFLKKVVPEAPSPVPSIDEGQK